MTTTEALAALTGPCNATTLMAVARTLNVTGTLVKRSGKQEVRAYALPAPWADTRIRALPELHHVA